MIGGVEHPPEPPRDAPREVELKLGFAREELERLLAHPLFRRCGHGRAVTKPVRSVYYDTPGLSLFRQGVVLRLRDAEHGCLQTVKTLGGAPAGLFDRPELEAPVPGHEPDLAVVADGALRATLLAETLQKGQTLQPVVETDTRRTKRLLRFDGSEIECAVDVGEVRTRAGTVPLCEVELELLSGSPRALFDAALELHASVPLDPLEESKPERGFALLTGTPPPPRRAVRLELTHDATLDDVLAAVVGEGVAQLSANRAPARAGEDPEGVHQLRVATRRLRSALALFKDVLPAEAATFLRAELRWLGGELGPARDLDVFLAELIEPLVRVRQGDGALKRIRDEAVASRVAAYDRVRTALDAPRTGRLLLSLGAFHVARAWRDQPLTPESARIFAPAREAARALLGRRHRRATRIGRVLEGHSAAELHELRIRMKKLRYAAEFLRPLFPRKAAEKGLRRMARLQDVLGHLNDVATAERLLGEQLAHMGPETDASHQRAAGFVLGWSARVAEERRGHLSRRWKRFLDTPRFWE